MKNEGQKTYKVGNQTALFLDAISKGYGFSDTVADAILLHYGQAQGGKIIEEFKFKYYVVKVIEIKKNLEKGFDYRTITVEERQL